MNILVNSTTQVLLVYNANMYLYPIVLVIFSIYLCAVQYDEILYHIAKIVKANIFVVFAYFLSSELDKMD